MGIDVTALEFQEAQVRNIHMMSIAIMHLFLLIFHNSFPQIVSLNELRKKWHIPPAFSVEFIGYYLDRISRSKDVKKNLQEQLELNKTLVSDQQTLREAYDEVSHT